jgi:EpsI family protein
MVVQKHPVWQQIDKSTSILDLPGGAVEVRTAVLRSYNQKLLVYYWNWMDGVYTTNDYEAKLLDAKGKLFGDDRAAAIIISTEFVESRKEAEELLREFVHDMLPSIEQVLVQARTGAVKDNID